MHRRALGVVAGALRERSGHRCAQASSLGREPNRRQYLRCWRLVSERCVRPDRVVVASPALDDDLCLALYEASPPEVAELAKKLSSNARARHIKGKDLIAIEMK